jgi:hypothetical protein
LGHLGTTFVALSPTWVSKYPIYGEHLPASSDRLEVDFDRSSYLNVVGIFGKEPTEKKDTYIKLDQPIGIWDLELRRGSSVDGAEGVDATATGGLNPRQTVRATVGAKETSGMQVTATPWTLFDQQDTSPDGLPVCGRLG